LAPACTLAESLTEVGGRSCAWRSIDRTDLDQRPTDDRRILNGTSDIIKAPEEKPR
jgi:hypothetical protein